MPEEQNTIITDRQGFIDSLIEIAQCSRRYLRIFSETCEASIFADAEVVEALTTFCHSQAKAQLFFLVPKNVLDVSLHQPLIRIAQRLPSKIEIRESVDTAQICQGQFAVGDLRAVLHQPQADSRHAYFNPDYPSRATQLTESFEQLWPYAESNPEFKALSL